MTEYYKSFPNYDDDSDYNTNANSYYKDLARKQKLIKLLAKRIWEYENTLNETLEQIEQRLTDYITENDLLMNERLENWDKRIDEMPEEMKSLFITWLNDGTLEQIINDDVLGNKADKSYVDEEFEKTYTQLEQIAIQPYMFGAVGDGVTDDKQALQETIEYCETNNYTLHSTPDYEYLTSGNEITEEISLSGTINLKAKEDNQEYVLKTTTKINSNADININGDYKSLYGLIGQSFGRSNFKRTNIERCKIWGMEYRATGNNNFITHDYFRGSLNGYREDITLTKVSSTSNVNSSLEGYGTYQFTTSVPEIYKDIKDSHFIIFNDEAYKIRTIEEETITILNFDPVNIDETVTVTYVSGGALNIPKHGDNGVGSFNGLDAISNRGVGVHNASLYSHKFNNLVTQGNAIGFTCNDYTISISLISPYFEINLIDMAVWNYARGIITRGVFNYSNFQTLVGRISGEFNGISGLELIDKQKGYLKSSSKPTYQPSNPINITPGFVNNYYKSSSAGWDFVIENDSIYDAYSTYSIVLNLSLVTKTGGRELKIRLQNDNGETVGGVTEYVHPSKVTGETTVLLYKVRDDWKVNVLSNNKFTNVNYAPVNSGQIAINNGKVYISTGTESNSDWKEVQFVEEQV